MIVTIITAIVCGFIGGVLGSMVLHDVLEQKYDRSVEDNARRQNETDKRLDAIDAQFKACTVALQELTYKVIRERGALWESINGLWNDYDERQKQAEPQKASEDVKKAATGSKAKKKEKNTND